MGTVWLADDMSLDSLCAVKLIDAEKSRSEEVRKRFVREAKSAAQLRGPHVVDVFDRGESDGVLFIAMEYLEGEDLCTRLGRVGALGGETTYRIIAHVARALSSAHALGIVHRDLKPENIFLVQSYDEEIAKVLDFGIAQHAAYRLEDHATREGSFLGTPYYVSPEQARGRPTDHRSDLWSLGVIAYQCLTGMPPFDSESLGDLMGLILYEALPKITEANPSLPPSVEEWWTRAAQRDRELRFQSARELTDSLGQALRVKTAVTVPTQPSVPPRRLSSYPDDGSVRMPIGTLAPLRTPQLALRESPRIDAIRQASTVEVGSAVASEPLNVTNVAVTRTRPSIHQVQQGLVWGYERLKAFPKRPLVVGAIGVGILLGAVITLSVSLQTSRGGARVPETQGSVSPLEHAGSANLPPAASAAMGDAGVLSAPHPEVTPVQLPMVEDPRRPDPGAKKSASPTGLPRRAPGGTPDYGI